ncbi:helix-turn-helix domain-containing protein [Rhizobium brockwellii]|uniref:helix-turn-helix domain-containing protein n=1 Tax=Rhizobium brockwellii TaxID=3019932 RepID=UPI003F996032
MGQRILLARHARRMTQQVLARELGMTFQQVQKYEKGKNREVRPSFTRLCGRRMSQRATSSMVFRRRWPWRRRAVQSQRRM